MTAYTTVGKVTKVVPVNSIKTELSEAGTVRQIDLSSTQAYEIAVTHPLLDSTDLSTVLTFYSSNKTASIAITCGDGYSYNAYFSGEPEVDTINGMRSNVTVRLVGNRA